MAGWTYSLGCSLVHLALLISIFFVNGIDQKRAKELDEDWHNKIKLIEASKLEYAKIRLI
jgi:hypothetical protein